MDENGVILTNSRRFSTTTKSANLIFETPLVIKAGEIKRLILAVDTQTAGTTQVYQFGIKSVKDINASSAVEGQFPIVSNQFTTTSYSAGTALVSNSNNTTGTLYVGDKNKELAVIKVDYNNSNNNNGILKVIRLKNQKRVDDYFDNFKVIINGENVLKKAVVNGKYVTFILKDYEIPYGSSRLVYVYGDVIGGESGDEPQFKVEDTSDIILLEKGSNASVNVQFDTNGD